MQKVSIEFLTKFILDNVWKRETTFWIWWQLEQVDGNQVQIIDSQSFSLSFKAQLRDSQDCNNGEPVIIFNVWY